jgi:hypothetical protein
MAGFNQELDPELLKHPLGRLDRPACPQLSSSKKKLFVCATPREYKTDLRQPRTPFFFSLTLSRTPLGGGTHPVHYKSTSSHWQSWLHRVKTAEDRTRP